ncbi:MAG: enoyl-CoA hydratase/isomerase family protein [Deltaproteobacteria bacterium]|nr:enoyl-CoA hydratase/isomerase family protein [Deltaproteobacteria bacterium]
MSDEPLVITRRDGPVAIISLNRAGAFNAFDADTITALWQALRAVGRDDAVRVVVLTGEGKAFCAGGDLKSILGLNPDAPGEAFYELATVFHQAITEIRNMKKPVIAAVNGVAAGGGFSMALACDLRVMARSAFLQQAYTAAGLAIDGGGTWTLPRLVGLAKALEIAMLDERIDADTALSLGLATRVVDDGAALDEALAMAHKLAAKAVANLGRVKLMLRSSFEAQLEQRLEDERIALAESANAPEGFEGLTAFSEKRKPVFDDPEKSS